MLPIDSNKFFLGQTLNGQPVQLSPEAMLRHVVVLGSSGSGKSVTAKVLIEEAVRKGIPAIIIDPQGDLASIGLKGAAHASTPDFIAREYWDKLDLKIWTPASSYGLPICVDPIVQISSELRYEDKIRAYSAVASSLASLVGAEDQETVSMFGMILEYADQNDYLIENLEDFADWLTEPTEDLEDRLDQISAGKGRDRLARKFRSLTMGAGRLLFELGMPIDIGVLLGKGEPKTRVSVIFLNSLGSQEEKEFFVGALCNSMYAWMLQNPSPGKPQAILYLDEAAPYLPPVRKPASKEPLVLLLRQARKYGVCLQIATQSPGDLDYKALGQIGTWFLGKVTTNQDLSKIDQVVRSFPGADVDAIMDSLPSFKKGCFVLANSDEFTAPIMYQSRFIVSDHKILIESQIEALISSKDREELG
jgi:hypothetical protein